MIEPKYAERSKLLKPSSIRQMMAIAKELLAQGKTVYELNIGQPDIPCIPEFVDGIMASGFMPRHDILMAYETAVMWVAGLEEAINQRRF